QRRLTAQVLNGQVGVLGQDAAPEVGVGATATGGLQVTLDDDDAKELIRPLNVQVTVHQQDTLALIAVQRRGARNVNNREIGSARRQWVYPIAPVQQISLVAQRPG